MDGFGPQFVMGDRDLSKRGGGTTRRLSEHVVTTWLRQLHVLIDFLFFAVLGWFPTWYLVLWWSSLRTGWIFRPNSAFMVAVHGGHSVSWS